MKFGARARMNENHQSINQSIASASKKAKSVPLCSIQTDIGMFNVQIQCFISYVEHQRHCVSDNR
jgi:hypothetical protein